MTWHRVVSGPRLRILRDRMSQVIVEPVGRVGPDHRVEFGSDVRRMIQSVQAPIWARILSARSSPPRQSLAIAQ